MTITTDGALTRAAAPLRASTWDKDELTFDIVLSAGAAVDRGAFLEVLDVTGASWPDTVPLLADHRHDIDNNLGDVSNIRLEGREIVGTVRLSRHSEKAKRIAAELSDGRSYAGSIGYKIEQAAESKPAGKRTLTATRWRIHECSLVSVPADPSSKIRSNPLTTQTNDDTTMTRGQQNAEVRSIQKATGLDDAWANGHIDADAIDLDAVRADAITALSKRTAPNATIRSNHNEQTRDNPEVRINAVGEAMFARANPGHEPSDLAREFMGMSAREVARDCLTRSGVLTTGLSDAMIVERGMMTTSDFPQIFASAANRQLRMAYAAAPSGIRQVAKQSTAKDFRAKTSISLANRITLEKVNEHGEFKNGSFIESAETYSIDTFGKIVPLSRRMLVDDDIGAFLDAAGRLGQAAAGFEADFLYAKISTNPLMADGLAVFHADHGNLATAAALSVDSLSAARQKLRAQTDAGANLIAITPRYLVVGPALETKAEQILSDIAAASVDAVNPFSGKLVLVVEPRMAGNGWFITADPGQVPSLEYSYLAGAPGPQISSQLGFRVDGIEYRVSLDFGAGWLDHRGWVKNAGA